MSSYNKLVKNSLIFALGNLGTKIITLLLVPFYTYYLTTDQYGITDLITTTISLLLPVMTLSIFEAVLRFALDEKYSKKSILNISIFITIIGLIVSLILYPILINVEAFSAYLKYFYIILFIQALNTTISQFSRAIGQVKLFALSGIVNTLVLMGSNILFLAVLKTGIEGYLISLILANLISTLFLIVFGKLHKYFTLQRMNKELTKEMLVYSIPLIPNAIMWWIMSVSSRYIITFFIGLGANGLYAVANKIPSLLTVLNSIFFQAWQMSAIEEADSKEKSKFYTKVFNVFSTTMFLSTSMILIVLKIVMKFFVSASFYEAWKYVPALLLSVVFSSFSSFLGTNYIAAKKTAGVFKTSVIGAIVNMVLSFTLIPWIGINGASIATAISFGTMWIVRVHDTKEFVDIKMDVKKLILTMAIIIIQIIVLYTNLKLEWLIEIILFTLLIFINKEEIKQVIYKFKEKITKK